MWKILFAAALTAALLCPQAGAQELWSGKSGNIENLDARAITVTRGETYLATSSELYRLLGPDGKWESVFSLPAGDNEIRCVACDCDGMLIGTRQGIFKSFDQGRTWRRVFKAIVPEKSDILSMDVSFSEEIVAGTGKGVYFSDDSGVKWSDASGVLKNRRVDSVVFGKDAVYAAGPDGIFIKRNKEADWERIYVSGSSEAEREAEDDAGHTDEGEDDDQGIYLALKGTRVYAGSRKIVYTDSDGKSWTDMPSDGLGGSVNCILPSSRSDTVYCATTKGVFVLLPGKSSWKELYRGTDKLSDVRNIVFGKESEDVIWAATANGAYRLESVDGFSGGIDVEKAGQFVNIIYDGEPIFAELQKAAMKFAEVDPGKIKAWRAQARLSALLPKISLGVDNDISNTYEIYTSATRDYITTGPDDISRGFDVSVSWELGKMVWSDDQTNIDVRSRLTTQLRNDILDDLRRAYYERKRLQFELISAPPKDLKARFEKELRVRELTQAIDDLTGNYFSDHIRVRGTAEGG